MRGKDMYLPNWLCGFGWFLIVEAFAAAIISFSSNIRYLVVEILCLGLGISAILCWKNQWIRILNGAEFEYSTMFGNRTVFQFSQVTGIRRNKDSWTLFVGSRKIHIESCAVISDALRTRFEQVLGNQFSSE